MRKGCLIIFACLMVSGVCFHLVNANTAAAEKLKFVADWVLGAKHAPFLLARDKGFYKKAGLDVSVSRGYGSGGSGKLLAEGKADFSFIDFGTMILLRSEGAKLKNLSAIHAIFPMGYVGLRSRGIKEAKDLTGKIFGGSPVSSTTYVMPSVLKRAGVDPSSVKTVHMEISAIIPAFLAGTIDFFGTYTINTYPITRFAVKKRGMDPDKELVVVLGVDYGLDAYSNGLTARDETIEKNPDLVRRWVRATMDAFRETVKNPETARAHFLKAHPEINKVTAAEELDNMIRSLLSPEAREIALGWSTEKKVGITQDMMIETGQMKSKKLPLNELYTNEFLEKKPVKKEEIPKRFQKVGLL